MRFKVESSGGKSFAVVERHLYKWANKTWQCTNSLKVARQKQEFFFHSFQATSSMHQARSYVLFNISGWLMNICTIFLCYRFIGFITIIFLFIFDNTRLLVGAVTYLRTNELPLKSQYETVNAGITKVSFQGS